MRRLWLEKTKNTLWEKRQRNTNCNFTRFKTHPPLNRRVFFPFCLLFEAQMTQIWTHSETQLSKEQWILQHWGARTHKICLKMGLKWKLSQVKHIMDLSTHICQRYGDKGIVPINRINQGRDSNTFIRYEAINKLIWHGMQDKSRLRHNWQWSIKETIEECSQIKDQRPMSEKSTWSW